MVRKKVTMSLSSRCLQLIDAYAETTGFESRSRVVEEVVFAISELLKYRAHYTQVYQQVYQSPEKEISQEQIVKSVFVLSDILSKFGGIFDRFERFENVSQKQTKE